MSNFTNKTVTLDDLKITDANRVVKYRKLSVLSHGLIDRGSLLNDTLNFLLLLESP